MPPPNYSNTLGHLGAAFTPFVRGCANTAANNIMSLKVTPDSPCQMARPRFPGVKGRRNSCPLRRISPFCLSRVRIIQKVYR